MAYTINDMLYKNDLKKIDNQIGELIQSIESLGISQKDIDHCTRHLINLYDDLESMTGVEI